MKDRVGWSMWPGTLLIAAGCTSSPVDTMVLYLFGMETMALVHSIITANDPGRP
jgi:hypothetical protein